jgi:DNA mismatch repair protein MutS2
MDAHSLDVLEFSAIIYMLRERTACALGDDFARLLEPTADLLSIREGQRETTEARTIIGEEGGLPLGGLHDVRPQVTKAGLEGMLQPSELTDVAGTLRSARRLRAFIAKRAEKCPKLMEIAANIGQFPRIEEAVDGAIGESGEVRDTASPELARIRSKLKTTHSRMVDKLHSIIQSSEFRTMIQDPVVTQRGDRYCIPVKAEHRHQFHGIVHDSSASGATAFIEPAAVGDMGNDLKELSIKEQQEVEKILRKLPDMVRAAAPDIQITLDAVGRLDFASAKARLSCDMDAVEPRLNTEGRIDLIKARHPLLSGEVVPIDVELGKRFKALLITGPNTGGKTVTLKTIGLLTLMAQAGLHIPAVPGSEIGVFELVFADIGDEQSIQQSLSTFSSHMTNIVSVIGQLKKSSLVLLDEIGAGTDPAEGAALAKAILEHLVARNARLVATTHYGELKEFAFVCAGVENASVEFDMRTLQPTYRLMIGVPGSSNAFYIASRLGMPEEVILSAERMVAGGEKSEEIIRKIEETHRAASEKEQLAERTSRDAETLKSRYEQQLDEVDRLRREMRAHLAEEVDRRVREKTAELDRIIEELKQAGSDSKKVEQGRQQFRQRSKAIRQEIEEILPPAYDEPEDTSPLKVGDRVKVISFGMEGDLLSRPGESEALVMVGSMKITVPFADLRKVRRQKPTSRRFVPDDEIDNARIATSKASSISSELKLIAQRVEQALINLDKYLDDAYLAGLPSVRIIHGVGTGALKKAVWEFLSNHHAVASFRLADQKQGGAGATIVEFKR